MILVYHAVDVTSNAMHLGAAALHRHIKWLSKFFRVVPASELIRNSKKSHTTIAITFDDGLLNHLDIVLPLLERYNVPATFFVPTSPLEGRDLLWFNYLSVLCLSPEYEEVTVDGIRFQLRSLTERLNARKRLIDRGWMQADAVSWVDNITRRYPVQRGELWDQFRGLRADEIRQLGASPLVEIGGHSITHPFLCRCSDDRVIHELRHSKAELERILDRPVDLVAYPGGDYDSRVADLAATVGYKAGFAMARHVDGVTPQFAIERTGVYFPSVTKLGVKVLGVGTALRRMGLRVG